MYRTADTTPECPMCGRQSLTDPTKFDPSEGYAHVHFRRMGASGSIFSDDRERVVVDRARICLECGHVLFFVGPENLAELREKLSSLETIDE